MSLSSYTPPPKRFIKDLMRPFRMYFSPRYYGLENFNPDKPALFIGNHTIYGLTDGFFLGAELYERHGLYIRALVDKMQKDIPIWKNISSILGLVPGSREACSDLMESGQSLMVFPGGTREAWKHKGEQYQLTWKKRVGFARMAIQHGYDIIPMTGLGGDDMYKILVDSQEIMASPIGKVLKATGVADKFLKGGENIPPITRGIGLTAIPKPERLYVKIGDRIDTSRFQGQDNDEEILFKLRGEVEEVMYSQLDDLKAYRRNDTDEEWWRVLLKKF